MATANPSWLTVQQRDAPLIVSYPHTGTDIPSDIEARCVSAWLARKDADWWIDQLYADMAQELGATIVHTAISRTVIDVNRDPSGVSLYPGQNTTELVPTATFDGEPLWKPGQVPDAAQIAHRRAIYFAPYHAALGGEIARLRAQHPRVALYDCHSIRSVIPRLFEGELPVMNIGTNSGAACALQLQDAIASISEAGDFSYIVNGRFKGGYITRHYGQPGQGVHAVQMELACRGYMHETAGPVSEGSWPMPFDADYAAPIRDALRAILETCLRFAKEGTP
ncbi:MAG TPA: N-formylglutamate deformylase [Hyphomicrobiaceae bacterium]|jgi:formiminoglutamase|nr:N-formylglutamate deformylase [Hyphomicrobiaceae bacterium]